MRGKIRVLESAFETVFTNLESSSTELVSAQDAAEVKSFRERCCEDCQENTYDTDGYIHAITILSNLVSRFSSMETTDISENQQPVIRDSYRFITGSLRECQYRLDADTEMSVDSILLEEIETEATILESRLVDAELLAQSDENHSDTTLNKN